MCGRPAFVIGDRSLSISHRSIALRSYENPSAATTGSRISSYVMGQMKSGGTAFVGNPAAVSSGGGGGADAAGTTMTLRRSAFCAGLRSYRTHTVHSYRPAADAFRCTATLLLFAGFGANCTKRPAAGDVFDAIAYHGCSMSHKLPKSSRTSNSSTDSSPSVICSASPGADSDEGSCRVLRAPEAMNLRTVRVFFASALIHILYSAALVNRTRHISRIFFSSAAPALCFLQKRASQIKAIRGIHLGAEVLAQVLCTEALIVSPVAL